MKKTSFKGRLTRIYVDRHNGYSVGELIQGVGRYDSIPKGIHVYGGNGTYINYDRSEYKPTDHKIMAEFEVECTYINKFTSEMVTEIIPKQVFVAKMPYVYTEKQRIILSLIADIVNRTYEAINHTSNFVFPLDHIKDTDQNIWRIASSHKQRFELITMSLYEYMREKFARDNATKEEILNNSELEKDYWVKVFVDSM